MRWIIARYSRTQLVFRMRLVTICIAERSAFCCCVKATRIHRFSVRLFRLPVIATFIIAWQTAITVSGGVPPGYRSTPPCQEDSKTRVSAGNKKPVSDGFQVQRVGDTACNSCINGSGQIPSQTVSNAQTTSTVQAAVRRGVSKLCATGSLRRYNPAIALR